MSETPDRANEGNNIWLSLALVWTVASVLLLVLFFVLT